MATTSSLYKSTSVCSRCLSSSRTSLLAPTARKRFGLIQPSQATRSQSSGYTTSPNALPAYHANATAQAHARHHLPTSQGLELHPKYATPSLPSSTISSRQHNRPRLDISPPTSSRIASTAGRSLLRRKSACRSFSSLSSRWSENTERPEPPDHLDEKERAIFDRLVQALEPSELQVEDISGGCGSMYAVSITSSRFKGLPVIKQHRLVNEILGEDIKSWHGIQLRTKAP